MPQSPASEFLFSEERENSLHLCYWNKMIQYSRPESIFSRSNISQNLLCCSQGYMELAEPKQFQIWLQLISCTWFVYLLTWLSKWGQETKLNKHLQNHKTMERNKIGGGRICSKSSSHRWLWVLWQSLHNLRYDAVGSCSLPSPHQIQAGWSTGLCEGWGVEILFLPEDGEEPS